VRDICIAITGIGLQVMLWTSSSLGAGVRIGRENKYQHYVKGSDLNRGVVSYKHDICLSWQEN